jgi:hypothetical protein
MFTYLISFLLVWSGIESTINEDTYWPILPAPDDDECGAIGGIIGRGNRSTRRKPAPVPLLPQQSHVTWRGLEPGPRRREASHLPPELTARPYLHITLVRRTSGRILVTFLENNLTFTSVYNTTEYNFISTNKT